MSAAMGFFPKGLKKEFEIAVVNEPSVFEPLKFYCIYHPLLILILTLLHINRRYKTESAIFVSLMCSLLPEDLHSEHI